MEAQLRRLGPNSKIKILKVPKECRTKIWLAGRGTSCQIYTKSKFASRQHFSITYKEHKYFISDLQSSNGTFVNDEKLVCETPLALGSIISVGVPSEMQDSQDCIVYIFESSSNDRGGKEMSLFKKEQLDNVVQMKAPLTAGGMENGDVMDVDPPQEFRELENGCDGARNPDEEKTFLNESDVVLIVSPVEAESRDMNGVKLAKKRRVEKESQESPRRTTVGGEVRGGREEVRGREEWQGKVNGGREEVRGREEWQGKVNGGREEVRGGEGWQGEVDEEQVAYDAPTQVDEVEVKAEAELLNYSLTEELIEISDSEEEWSGGLKGEEGRSPEEGEEDEVVFLERIVRSKEAREFDAAAVAGKVEDELTEVDKKWLGRLLKIKKEDEFLRGSEERGEEGSSGSVMAVEEMSGEKAEESVDRCKRLSRVWSVDGEEESGSGKGFGRIEVPKRRVQGALGKKSVRFDMVPQIRYFKVPSRPKLTACEKGKQRFTRIIFNICNWNTHWLEECRRVAPDKDPPDICDERLRKIPKKFPSHSDYMGAFIPAMLLQLWNKVKDKWVSCGESGFRQTVSCDSYEDYHTENLWKYKCTGLVQNVEAHKDLLREGHLVLLRLHQSQKPEFTTPGAEKYSKKLGYLVFGFVESKSYERFQNQVLHQSLAERCASIMGDLHVVRLTILVKKRPSFQVDKRRLIQLMVVQRISQEIRMFRGICFLPNSPLCTAILKPTKVEFSLVDPPKKERLVFKGPLDDVQSEIVRKLSYACSSTNSFLYSVHGAAGTGKGQVVAALILQLLQGDEWKSKKPKVIYCTQWSVPLDEMVAKLRSCSESLDDPLRLVRVGPIKEIKPEVRDLCLVNLAASLRVPEKRGGRKFDAEIELLKDADVICATCLTSGIAKMSSAFEQIRNRDRGRKVICILDEAMSCSEKDSVIPLLLGVTHLILVGDIYQLEPPFSGEKTHTLGLDMPLFWRIYKNFTNLPKELWPICILKTQYRMNASLSKFTSLLIYSTYLQKPEVNVSNRIPNIRTHLVLVDQALEDSAKAERERTVSQLVQAVVKLVKAAGKHNIRLAVMTCDTRQMEGLQVLLPKREFPEVEVEQLQAFQGREFDVVVFVCDGRKVVTSWLSTALTRARCSLFVLTSQQYVSGNSLIRKMTETAEKYNFLKYVRPNMGPEEFEEIITA